MSRDQLPGDEGVIAHRYRRYLLYCLYVYTAPMRLPDIADQLAVWDPYTDDDNEFLRERLRIYDVLYYDHLPLLREADVVVYNQDDDMVDLGPNAAEFRSTLERNFRTEFTALLHAEQSTFDTNDEPT